MRWARRLLNVGVMRPERITLLGSALLVFALGGCVHNGFAPAATVLASSEAQSVREIAAQVDARERAREHERMLVVAMRCGS